MEQGEKIKDLLHGIKNGGGFCPLITYYRQNFNGSGMKKYMLSCMGEKNGECVTFPPVSCSY